MKTITKIRHLSCIKLMVLLGLALNFNNAQAQTRTYLSGTKTGNYIDPAVLGVAAADVSSPMVSYSYGLAGFRFFYGPASVLTQNTTAPSTLTASRLNVAVGLSGADVYVQFRNTGNNNIAAGTTTYFKLKEQPANTGINVNVGTVLGLSNIYNIRGSAYKGASNYALQNGLGGFNGAENAGTPITNNAQTVTKLVIDKNDEWNAAVTPPASEAYNAVRLNVALPEGLNLLSVASTSANVYNAYTITPGGSCSVRPIFTGYGNTGISLSANALLAGLNLNSLVENAHQAIDDDANTASSFNSGILNVGVASTVAQEFIFDHVASATDAVKIHFEVGASIINLDLLSGGVTFKAYRGTSTTPVATQTLEENLNLLRLNLANLLTVNNNYADINTTFKPGVQFDRIEVSLNAGLVKAGVIEDALKIYDVELSAPAPTISSSVSLGVNNSLTVYAGQTIPAITATSTGNNILFYQGNNTTALAAAAASPANLPVTSFATAGTYTYFAAAQIPGCTNISAKVPITIIVLPLTRVTLPSGTLSSAYNFSTPLATSPNRTLTYTLASGTLPSGLTLNQTTGLITGTPIQSGTFDFTVAITDITNSGSPINAGTYQYSLIIVTNLTITGGAYPSATKGTAYSQQMPTNLGAKLGIAPYTYVIVPPGSGGARVNAALALPSEFTLSTNGVLSGTPSTAGTSTFTIRATDAENNSVQANYTILVDAGPLPVTLASFTATKEGQQAILNWSTTTETNSDRFEIERSQNGNNWEMIGTKLSGGESTSLNRYNFTDTKPSKGENLYRLKMIDRDATYAYSRIQSLTFESGIQTSFYPNPVADKLIIEAGDFSLVKNVKIFDQNGKTVYQSAARPVNEINVTNLSSGLYIIQLTNKNGAVTSHKVIKQ